MTEYELDNYCKRHPHCDCDCMRCEGFASYQRQSLGYEEYCLEQEIMETACDDMGF